jgi:uncharacterized protein YhjY with autotransporter beta-barrel domain
LSEINTSGAQSCHKQNMRKPGSGGWCAGLCRGFGGVVFLCQKWCLSRRVGSRPGPKPGDPIPRFRTLIAAVLVAFNGSIMDAAPTLGAIAVAFGATGARDAAAQVNASCSGSPTANCTDVPADGISYNSGVTTVNVGDGAAGETLVAPGKIGIELTRTGAAGADEGVTVEFQVISYDVDPAPGVTELKDVVSADGTTPLLSGGEYIFANGGPPATSFTIGTVDYTGEQLMEYLATTSDDPGGSISGGLTVNNNAGGSSSGAGAPFATTDADGIRVNSTGGGGGSGRCHTILVYTWCNNGDTGGSAGPVVVNSNASITLNGSTEGKYGVTAVSQGGAGGNGGGSFGLFASKAGRGGNGGKSGTVFVTLGVDSNITTHAAKSHGVFAESRGGDGGSGGAPSGLVALGTKGGNGGDAGNVNVINQGSVLTTGENAHGIYARSVGAGAGKGSGSGGFVAIGGNGGGQSSGARVGINNSGSVETRNGDSFGIFAQSIGGGGGDGGSAGGLFSVGGKGGSGGNSDRVTVFDSGSVKTSGDGSMAIVAQSIGGGGGNGGNAFAVSPTISVAVGGAGGLGGIGHEVSVTAEGSDIDTAGNAAHGIFAQSIGGGGGSGGTAVSGALPTGSAVNVSVALGGNAGGGGDAGDTVSVTTSSSTDIDTKGTNAYGIAAQSIGGGGGDGGSAYSATGGASINVAVAVGGKGGVAGAGKSVVINNGATITTSDALSTGILAQSVGGGGGNGGFAGTLAVGAGSVSVGLGAGAGGGGSSGLVDVTNSNTIETGGENAIGIFAQSVGGGGGNGGSALAGSAGLIGVSAAIGGRGGAGSNGGEVSVDNSGNVSTSGGLSYGIFGQSVGGGGGNGGFALSGALGISVEDVPGGAAAISIGGKGGGASSGGRVSIENAGTIQSGGLGAHAIFAQSVGGGGGSGGFAGSVGMTIGGGAAFGVSVGGGASGGGNAGVVDVQNTNPAASLITGADGADGIHAQSVGGGGGDGGFAMSGAFGFGGEASVNVAVAIGGAGGAGGEGNTVDVSNYAAISTHGKNANGIFGQSVGGGGGNGGLAVSGTLGLSETSGNVGVTVGGGGGIGNIARDMRIANFGAISTSGIDSVGILGQSIGGSGGNGGLALTAQLTGATKKSATVGVSIGGGGGTGNSAGIVEISNDFGGAINTTGFGAHGIEAQSIGGGGGNGGMAIVGQLGVAFGSEEQATKTLNVGVTVGGAGGGSGFGNTVHVTNNDSIEVMGDTATGIFAQSIGGGGGNGGGALNAIGMLTDSTNNDSRSVVATVTVGGGGGPGNHGGAVTVDNGGRITTHGVGGYGVLAQSVGGGGGIGGRANTFSLVVTDACTLPLLCKAPASNKNNFQLGVTVGGSGGGASNGGVVTVNNTGGIETFGNMSDGIYAQSIGGGGGAGGNGILGSGEILPVPVELPFILAGSVSFYKNLQVVVGGNAGSSGDGGMVDVSNNKNITTHGSNANGILAQSVGGGGGVGGKAAIGATGTFGLGGAGGAAGKGGDVTVDQSGGATIETYGSASYGIFAQSVGGGGGVAGNIDRALSGVKLNTPAGLNPTNIGIGLAFGRSGGGGGNGGIVDVDVDGRIITHGDNAAGIFAQSVGGGGGVLGELGNDLPVLSLLSWQIGSAGDDGNAGRVDVDLTGSIATAGNNATGIFAQSAGGKGTAGAVNVTLNSSILTGEVLRAGDENRGLGSIGILAQSAAANNADNGDITVAINSPDAIVRGGRSQVVDADRKYVGVGVWVMDGKNNTINNMGQITTLGGVNDGFAILATGSDATHPGGGETVNNFGIVTGSVNLGKGDNAFNNNAGATFNTGPMVDLGSSASAGTLTNGGRLSPGGSGVVMTTALTGDLHQTGTGTYAVDLNPQTGASDRIDVSGTANLGGKAAVNLVDPGFAKPGNQASIILTGAGGATDAGLSLANEPLPVVGYTLSFADKTDVALTTSIDFAPAGLNANNSAIGRYVNDIQSAGGTPGFAPIAARLLSVPDIASLADAYDRLSPEPLLIPSITTVNSDLRFSDALHSCRVREGEFRFVSEGECSWVRLVGSTLDQDRTDSNLGFTSEVYTIAAGIQKKVDANWHAGFGFSVDSNRLHSSDIAKSDGNQFAFGVIAKRNAGPAAFSASANVGYGSYDNTRYVNLPGLGTTATSDQHVTVVSAHVRASYDFEHKNVWYLRPLIDAGVTYVHQGGFNEQGAGAANLNVNSSDDTTVSLQPRLEFGREFAAADGTLIRPFGMVGVTQFLSGTTPSIAATLQGAPAGVAPFTVESRMDKTYGDVSVGVDVLGKDGMTLRVGYTGRFSNHSSFHSGGLKLSIPF